MDFPNALEFPSSLFSCVERVQKASRAEPVENAENDFKENVVIVDARFEAESECIDCMDYSDRDPLNNSQNSLTHRLRRSEQKDAGKRLSYEKAQSERMDCGEPMKKSQSQTSLADRLRQAEIRHASDRATWKLKLESAVAQAEKAFREKEEFRIRFEEISTEHHIVSSKNFRLEEQVQHSDKEFKKSMFRTQRELKLEVAELNVQTRLQEAELQELKLYYQIELEKETRELKFQKEDLIRQLKAQKDQASKLQEVQKKFEALTKVQAEQTKERDRALTTQKHSTKEIAGLRDQLKKLNAKVKEKEVELTQEKERQIDALREEVRTLEHDLETLGGKLSKSTKREKELSQKVKDLEEETSVQRFVMQKQDEGLVTWQNTTVELKQCCNELFQLEQQSALSYRNQMDSLMASIKVQLEEAASGQETLATACTNLQNEVSDWKSQCGKLEIGLTRFQIKSDNDDLRIAQLLAKLEEREALIKKQEIDLEEWKDAARKMEQCVEEAMRLESEAGAHYSEQTIIWAGKHKALQEELALLQIKLVDLQVYIEQNNILTEENKALQEEINQLQLQIVDLQAENAGLRVDEELGLEAVYSYASISKDQLLLRASTQSTTDLGSYSSMDDPAINQRYNSAN